MKTPLTILVCTNLLLLGSTGFLLLERREMPAAPIPMPMAVTAPAPPETTPSLPVQPPAKTAAPFRWQQLESRTDYRKYIANLRAIGCPEPTVEDIVRGDTDRAFAWERQQLALDSSGTGPWSQYREDQLVSSLLGEPTDAASPAQTAARQIGDGQNDSQQMNSGTANQTPGMAAARTEPLFMQNVNWGTLGFSADDQAAIAQVRQQYEDQMKNQNAGNSAGQNSGSSNPNSTSSNPNSVGSTTAAQTPAQNPDDQLKGLLGADAYAAYEQAQYYQWFQPQALAHVGSGPLIINAN